ncbi:MAG: 2-oxoacid:acceptor oxidoreductase family protein [Alphaproteobacteria bacterium]|jgi:2-oxoglutarate ferredoxin oxidoreductase subunit gamma|nr:2-oxoacid:acceptor oxidoreductase family protein [Alphaproteobacteria bacterium]MDP6563505.1 2-oxoacid:acceptor oxidoreductase family protein [Alphaproteobacteria bacterium]MDP6812691.1 2-oxoacid:acceptor oxidoreductase family protein [Alphaproteobacteria bacterium]
MSKLEIRFAGSGGQGLILSGRLLFQAVVLDGKRAAQSQSYEPTSRGGFCNSDLVVADREVDYPLVTAIDYLIALDQIGVAPSAAMMAPGALVLTDARLVPEPPEGDITLHQLPFTDEAIALGSHRAANVVALGTLVGLSGICDRQAVGEAVREGTPKAFLDLNLEALRRGFEMADELDQGEPDGKVVRL